MDDNKDTKSQASKAVVYTCITGNYDRLAEPQVISSGLDYVCFTDDMNRTSKVWKFRPIPRSLRDLSAVKQQRLVKIRPHAYLPEYDASIWIDGNLQAIGDIQKLLDEVDLSKFSLYTRVHPTRTCIYDEAEACIRLHKDTREHIQPQLDRYRSFGYPEKIGMAETNVIIRKHNDLRCILVDDLWATELIQFSHRDQLSFNYACWKNHFLYGHLSQLISFNQNPYLKKVRHGC